MSILQMFDEISFMKTVILLLFVIAPFLLIAQRQNKYPPIDSVGWELPDLTELSIFDTSGDAGAATFLLIVNSSGKITKIKTISNTFSSQRRSDLKQELKNIKLVRKADWKGNIGFRGLLQISASSCAVERDENNMAGK